MKVKVYGDWFNNLEVIRSEIFESLTRIAKNYAIIHETDYIGRKRPVLLLEINDDDFGKVVETCEFLGCVAIKA